MTSERTYKPSPEVEAIVDGYRLLDDNFMTMFFDQNFEATTLVLNIILERTDIQVEHMEVQKQEKNASPDGRNLILDIFAVDASGKHYDIEIQRADHGADIHRARFHSGVLDSRMLKTGEDFSKLNESYVIFITEKDVLGAGLPLYHVRRMIEELQTPFRDGNNIIYVNGAYQNEDTDIGKLMHDFRCTRSAEMFYSVLKDGMHHYKETEGGRDTMCKSVEVYGDKRELNGEMKKAVENALAMIAGGKLSLEEIAQYSSLPLEKVKELAAQQSA